MFYMRTLNVTRFTLFLSVDLKWPFISTASYRIRTLTMVNLHTMYEFYQSFTFWVVMFNIFSDYDGMTDGISDNNIWFLLCLTSWLSDFDSCRPIESCSVIVLAKTDSLHTKYKVKLSRTFKVIEFQSVTHTHIHPQLPSKRFQLLPSARNKR